MTQLAYKTAVLADSPAVYFRCGEASGTTAVDSSGNNVAASYAGSGVTLQQSGPLIGDSDRAVNFDGTNGYISVNSGTPLTITGPLTVELWIQFYALPTDGNTAALVYKASATSIGYFLHIANNSGAYALQVGCYDTTSTGTDPGGGGATHFATWNIDAISAAEWHHVVGVYDGYAWRLYWDGAQKAFTVDAQGPLSTTGQLIIGGYYDDSTVARKTNGYFDEVAIYSHALTAERIRVHYAQGAGTLTPGTLSLMGRPTPAINLQLTAIAGGVGPYSTQLQRSATSGSGYVNVGAPVLGQTPTFTDSPTQGAYYYYIAVTTDSIGNTATSAEFQAYAWNTAQAGYCARQRGIMLAWNTATFTASDSVSGAVDARALFGNSTPSGAFTQMTLDIAQWITAIQSAGATFAVLTVKSGDGFRLWPSASSVYNLANSTWYGNLATKIDITAQFVSMCRAAGISPGLYYAADDIFQANNTATYPSLHDYDIAALQELAAYQPDIIYMDGMYYVVSGATLPYADVKAAIKAIAPNCAIICNNQQYDLALSDVLEYERPNGVNVALGNILPANETLTIRTDNYYYDHADSPTLYTASFLNLLTRQVNYRNAPILINCPPDRTGVIPSATVTLMAAMGPAYTVSASGSATAGRPITLTYTRTNSGTLSTGNLISPTDGQGGAFGTFTFTNGGTVATQTYTPLTGGSKRLTFTNNAGFNDALPTVVSVANESAIKIVNPINRQHNL